MPMVTIMPPPKQDIFQLNSSNMCPGNATRNAQATILFFRNSFFQSSWRCWSSAPTAAAASWLPPQYHNTTWFCMISSKECSPSRQPHIIWNETAYILWNHKSKSFNLISDHDSACIRNCKCFQVGWWNRFRIKENIASSSKQLSFESILNDIWV